MIVVRMMTADITDNTTVRPAKLTVVRCLRFIHVDIGH